jgi:anionic cell wall polymer biosynthesis LytR-Cps2A-Psr (LCP) family protein
MTQYEIVTTFQDEKVLKRTDDNGQVLWIPMDEANSDYQAYLNKDKPQVKHLTEISPQAALSTPSITE